MEANSDMVEKEAQKHQIVFRQVQRQVQRQVPINGCEKVEKVEQMAKGKERCRQKGNVLAVKVHKLTFTCRS